MQYSVLKIQKNKNNKIDKIIKFIYAYHIKRIKGK